jgi:MFS family permease
MDSQSPPPPTTTPRRLLGIQLSVDTTPVNFIFYLLACAITIALFVFMNASQPFVLSILHGVDKNAGDANASLVFYDQILSIALLGTWGVVSDKIGRRVIFVLGFLTMSVAFCGATWTRSVYPDQLVARLVFAVGAAACASMVTAVLGDYVGDKDRGKVSGAR